MPRWEAVVYVSVEASRESAAQERLERCLTMIPGYAPPEYQCRYQMDDSGVVLMEERDDDVQVKKEEVTAEDVIEALDSARASTSPFRFDLEGPLEEEVGPDDIPL